MSTQSARSILLTQRHPQQGLRLLELPPELADQLSSKEPPTLELKSPSASIIQRTSEPGTREYVNLCTPTQTYQVRQVQSSNSIHILRQSDADAQRGDVDIVGEDDSMNLVESVTSIAKCGSTLELHTPAGGFSAIPFLEKSLRMYTRVSGKDMGADVDMDSGTMHVEPTEKKRVIEEYFADIPVSRGQCESGWFELCAFVSRDLRDGATCWQPSPRVKLDVWKKIVDGAVLHGIDLEKQFLANDLWKAVIEDGEEPFPQLLFEAVLRRVCESGDGQHFSALADIKWASLDKTSCARWFGETYLEAMAPTSGMAIGRSEFLNAWKDYLPESWRDEASLSKLTDGTYKHPDPTTICFMGGAERQKAKEKLPTESGAAAKKTRNWHEFFKSQKRR